MDEGPSPSFQPPKQKTRRTRFVYISDTHNSFPGGGFKLPPGDVLIHAGDLTNQGTFEELQKAVKWIEEADFEVKIVVAGNHDITLDTDFYARNSSYFHAAPADSAACLALFTNSPDPRLIYLDHESATITLRRHPGPRTTFKIFGSPFSPAKDMWAFGYSPSEAQQIWDKIPFDTDILLTHTPPKYHLDERSDRRSVGCEALRERMWRVRPRLHVCGHVHESRGAEVIRWDLSQRNLKFKEESTTVWNDPGAGEKNKKLCVVNLTAKGGANLDNDGARGDWVGEAATEEEVGRKRRRTAKFTSALAYQPPSLPVRAKMEGKKKDKGKPKLQEGLGQLVGALAAVPEPKLPLATIGQGGVPPSGRCDLEALSGRMGRRETCVVNCAISGYSHGSEGRRRGGKVFNKPIVVDLELPVWECEGG